MTDTPTLDELLRGGLLWLARPDLQTLCVTGPDREKWLNGMVTCDLGSWPQGAGRWGLILDRKARILADLLIARVGERIEIGACQAPTLRDTLDKFLIMEEAEIALEQAPHSWAIMLGGSATNAVGLARELRDITVQSSSIYGFPGAIVVGATDSVGELANAVCTSLGPMARIVPQLPTSQERFLLGIAWFGQDYDIANHPIECGLDSIAISSTKGCYLGQETVTKTRVRGIIGRKLVRLTLPATQPVPERGATVLTTDDQSSGEISSAMVVQDRVIAFAMVRPEHSAPGKVLRVNNAAATVHPCWSLLA